MAKQAEDAERVGLVPQLKKRLYMPRNVFSPGHRIRMNIVPMFLMIFVPWGIFIFVLGLNSFYMMYMRPLAVYILTGLCFLFWVATVIFAINRRKYDPEPAWYTFFAGMVGLAVIMGFFLGSYVYSNYSFPYYQVKDLKVISNLDPNAEHGQNVMDAGMFYFAPGSKLDAMRAWHFKQKTVYCAAPIIKGHDSVDSVSQGTQHVPQTQSFDFWAVGKDCCSVSASDFRCGDYNNALARGGIRNMRDEDRAFYRLAVEQASALYGIQATNPIFFQWSTDPLETVNSWNSHGFRRYLAYVVFAFVFFAFAMSMATCKFSFMGRAESVYGEDIYNDPDWQKGGFQQTRLAEMDLHTHERRV
jgi:hypothetical protein